MKTIIFVALAAIAVLLASPFQVDARGGHSGGGSGWHSGGGSGWHSGGGSGWHSGGGSGWHSGGSSGWHSGGHSGWHSYGHGSRAYFRGGVVVSPWWGPGWSVGWGPWWGPGWSVGWGPWWGGGYPYYNPYYTAPPVIIRQSPNEYIERNTEQSEAYYWYFCRNPQGYYPYVKQCPNGWLKVLPSPSPSGGEE
jgi:hypothetical protein